MKLEIVSMIRINGVDRLQEEIPVEELREILEKKLDENMKNFGLERIKTA